MNVQKKKPIFETAGHKKTVVIQEEEVVTKKIFFSLQITVFNPSNSWIHYLGCLFF